MRWECRHSSAEMAYLEVVPAGVRLYLNRPDAAEVWPFVAVLAGDHDAVVRAVFGDAVLAAVQAEVRRRAGG